MEAFRQTSMYLNQSGALGVPAFPNLATMAAVDGAHPPSDLLVADLAPLVPCDMRRSQLHYSVLRGLGYIFGAIPGWYVLLVEPIVRNRSHPEATVSHSGVCMRIDFDDFVQRKHYFRAYERRELRFLRRFLREGDMAVDVGANVGVLTMQMARAVGGTGRVVAVEPVPQNLARLRINAALNPSFRVEILPIAASAAPGTIRLGRASEEIKRGNYGAYSAGETTELEVAARPLDDAIVDHIQEAGRVRLLKIDVEGMEDSVLEGSRQLLESHLIDAVVFELNPSMIGDQGAIAILTRYGYKISVLGMGASLRPMTEKLLTLPRSKTSRAPARTVLGTVRRWLRGEIRLYTLVATIE